MYYEIWDVVTRNLIYDFDTLDQALNAVQELAEANPEPGRVNLALGQVDENDRTTWLARGDALLEMLKQRPAV
jgi:hypothetical protein